MPVKKANPKGLSRDVLRRIADQQSPNLVKKRLAELGILYSEESRILSNYINKMIGIDRVYPQHNPIQASYRWSTVDPPITNWKRSCINPSCPHTEHEWTDECWSIRDIICAPEGYAMVTWDHDNIEGRIHDIIVNDPVALEAHRDGLDLHTITCCDMFGYDYPTDRRNPHTAERDADWRTKYNWRGKDTDQRVLAKNFNHGSKYTDTYLFVRTLPNIGRFNLSLNHLEQLAKKYIASKGEAWERKLRIMDKIRRDKIARTLYGARRLFFVSEKETGHKGFSHMISGTVSHYNNETLILFDQMLGDDCVLAHNAHDGDKLFIKNDNVPSIDELRKVIERDVSYYDRSITLTATVKIYE